MERYFLNMYDVYVMMFRYNISFNSYYLEMKPRAIFEIDAEYYVLQEDYDELEEENRKLKERIKELEQCNLNLQTWIDNKEKVNKQLREELERYKKQYEHTM